MPYSGAATSGSVNPCVLPNRDLANAPIVSSAPRLPYAGESPPTGRPRWAALLVALAAARLLLLEVHTEAELLQRVRVDHPPAGEAEPPVLALKDQPLVHAHRVVVGPELEVVE